jgi:hypothetical protein
MTRAAAVLLAVACASLPGLARAQAPDDQESRLGSEFRREGEALGRDCKHIASIIGCGTTLLTGEPMHISAGTIAPGNGLGAGPAFVWHSTPSDDWRINGSADAIWAPGGSWRVGAYTTFVRTAMSDSNIGVRIHPYPVIKAYAQVSSLATLPYYGIGSDTLRSDKAVFGFREAIVGSQVLWPITAEAISGLNMSVLGEINGRFVKVMSAPDGTADPSIEQRYTDATAPGLTSQPGAAQFGEGLRFAPSVLQSRLRFDYRVWYQQFAASSSDASFARWTIDLRHEIPVFGTSVPTARDTNSANECAIGPTSPACPPVALSNNRTGSIALRAMLSRSVVSGSSAVPFYFQHTLGGSDLDGNRVLPSYDDYRFRGPHLLLFQETFEHSLFGWPIGLWLSADQGRVGAQGESLTFSGLRHSEAIGLSFRAGGLPVALLTYATGGPEGHHVALTMSPTLLGGSSRPALQ